MPGPGRVGGSDVATCPVGPSPVAVPSATSRVGGEAHPIAQGRACSALWLSGCVRLTERDRCPAVTPELRSLRRAGVFRDSGGGSGHPREQRAPDAARGHPGRRVSRFRDTPHPVRVAVPGGGTWRRAADFLSGRGGGAGKEEPGGGAPEALPAGACRERRVPHRGTRADGVRGAPSRVPSAGAPGPVSRDGPVPVLAGGDVHRGAATVMWHTVTRPVTAERHDGMTQP